MLKSEPGDILLVYDGLNLTQRVNVVYIKVIFPTSSNKKVEHENRDNKLGIKEAKRLIVRE